MTNSDHTQQVDELRTLVEKAEGSPMGDMTRPELPAYLLAAICVIAIVVLTIHGDPVPDVLNVVTVGALGVGGAITSPRGPTA